MSLVHGDCVAVMAGMEPESVDAVVCDPPYGLEFMGKKWDGADGFRRSLNAADAGRDDVFGRTSRTSPEYRTSPMRRRPEHDAVHTGMSRQGGRQWRGTDGQKRQARDARTYQEWCQSWAEAALRVTAPSGYLLAFGGTRTVHRLASAIEDAGWIIRDTLVWAYAQGFPKSQASLKPAWEPIVMARKPGPLRMLNIDGCRIPLTGDEAVDNREGEPTADTRYGDKVRATPGRRLIQSKAEPSLNTYGDGLNGSSAAGTTPLGRWPANVILTDAIFDGGVEGVVGGGETTSGSGIAGTGSGVEAGLFGMGSVLQQTYGDSGTYSRFFLLPKADRADREPVLGGLPLRDAPKMDGGDFINPAWGSDSKRTQRQNVHPTVKPVDLMRHLVRLVTPSGGVVLDPFLGSGTTAIAAEMEGFRWIGIEKEAEYVAIAEARLNGTQRGLGLPA